MYLNKAFIIGNLTRDPEMRSLPSGSTVTNFSLATNRRYKDANGNWQEATDYHNVVVFGRQAETTAQYLKKGSSALVEGRMQTRSWEQDGQKKYRTEVVADRVQFGSRGEGGNNGGGKNNYDHADSQDSNEPDLDTIEYPTEEINPDDIPF
jgi:single-strand DNA-binding protein